MKKNFNVLDLFAGAGGFSKGFEQEKFKILFANEINSNIIEKYNYTNDCQYFLHDRSEGYL